MTSHVAELVKRGSFRVRVYAGLALDTKRPRYLFETVPSGPDAEHEAEQVRLRLISKVDQQRDLRLRATLDELVQRHIALAVAIATSVRKENSAPCAGPASTPTTHVLHIRASVAHDRNGLVVKDTKLHHDRQIALDRHTTTLLTAYRDHCQRQASTYGTELAPDSFIFSPVPEGTACLAPASLTGGIWLPQAAVWALATFAVAGYTGLVRKFADTGRNQPRQLSRHDHLPSEG